MSFNSGMKGADVVALLKNGLPIVDDVNKLDPNAEVGSMASVAVQGDLVETSVRNLYQPDASMIDSDAGILTAPELLSSVSSIKVFVPTDINNVGFTPVNADFCFIPRDFSPADQNMVWVRLTDGVVFVEAMIDGMYTELILVDYSSDAGNFIAHDDQVEAFNAILANGRDWCYFSDPTTFNITEDQFNTIDLFVNIVSGVPTITDVYIKKGKWELFMGPVNNLSDRVDAVKNELYTFSSEIWEEVNFLTANKANNITMDTYPVYLGASPNVYTTYSISSTGSVSIKLAAIQDSSVYNEYILELKCTSTPSSVSFTNTSGTTLKIKWANDTPPTFEAGYTYLISIANNFGVFAQYINS